MKHVTSLIVKNVFVGAITIGILRGVYGNTLASSLWVSIFLTLALYILGDMMILPSMGNVTATVADAGVALLLTWLSPTYSGVEVVPFGAALAIAALIGVAEYYYHAYLERWVLPGPITGPGG